MLCKSIVNKKQVIIFFLVLLKYREIITVKSEILHKKLYFFIKSLKSKKKKLALTSFYYVKSRNMVGQFKKAYLHRPFKILDFLTPARIQSCFK